MRIILLFAVLLICGVNAYATDLELGEREFESIKPLFVVCLPTALSGSDPADVALQLGFEELPKEVAERFLPDVSVRAFSFPKAQGNSHLMIDKDGACNVLIRELDEKQFWEVLSMWLASTGAHFVQDTEYTDGPGIMKVFLGFDGQIVVYASTSQRDISGKKYDWNGMLSARRLKGKK